MNISVLGRAASLAQGIVGAHDLSARRAVINIDLYGDSVRTLHLPGPALGKVAAVLVMVTAFASVFSLLLGYSRIPYAAARDGNFFRVFGRLHAKGFPHVSLLVLGAAAICFCFFSLADVIGGAGGAADFAAVPDAACGRDLSAKDSACAQPAVPDLAVSAAAASGDLRLRLHLG